MAKKLIFIGVMAALLAALGLALILLRREEPAKPGPGLPPVEYLIDYRDEQFGGLASITVENDTGAYTILPGDPPRIPGWESLIVNTFPLARIVDICDSLMSRGLVEEEPEDLAIYGLDRGRARVAIKTKGGDETTLYIGNEVPDRISVYVRLEGRPGVYQAGKGDTETFLQGIFDFVDKEVSPQGQDDGYGGFEFGEIVLGGAVRPDGPVRIIHEAQENVATGRLKNSYRIAGPMEGVLNLDKGYNILKTIPGITASRVIARISGAQDLAPYGLAPGPDTPYSTVQVTGTLAQGLGGYGLRASKPDAGGNVYIYREGTELVYQTAASGIPWLTATWWDLMDRLIILPFIDDVARVEVSTPARKAAFTLNGEGDELKVEAQGTELDTSVFRKYYQTLLTAIYDEYTEEPIPPGAAPILEIAYHYRDGRAPDRVSFYNAASRRVLTSLNGRRPFYTFSAYVDKVLSDLDRILEGKQVIPYL
jgi:hypothetical protein